MAGGRPMKSPAIFTRTLTYSQMKNKKPMTVAEAGKRGGKAKNAKLTEEQRKEIMAEVRKGKGVHPKLHTLKVPCPKPGCTVTVNHEHI
jgi:hypothetical protein